MTQARTEVASPAIGSDVGEITHQIFQCRMAARPLEASEAGYPGYDGLLADLTVGSADARRLTFEALAARLADIEMRDLTLDERITWLTGNHAVEAELTMLRAADVEHTVSVMAQDGVPTLLWMASQARLGTSEEAAGYLARVRAIPGYLGAHLERLRVGQAAGRLPVAALVRAVLEQVDDYLAGADGDCFADVIPGGWSGADEWVRELRAVVAGEVRPSITAWREEISTLATRPDEACGLTHLSGGDADYRRLIAMHTTLDLTAEEIHDIGLAEVERLRGEMTVLGRALGLASIDEVVMGLAVSRRGTPADVAMEQARAAIARAEAVIPGVFAEPLPPPCRVAPMAAALADAGVPPHYTAPSPDGLTWGTFWFNSAQPETGSGWGLAALAFHEAVPGHHLQTARAARATHLGDLQRHSRVTAHSEGWGVYAEVLAGELGLYADTESRIGALGAQLFRAARLVVDTGIHALGWSRAEAVTAFTGAVPLPTAFAEAEINRYIGDPGQALAYTIGLREILRLRDAARARLGEAFDLSGFHSAVLDHGSIPLPALALAVADWGARLD